jgi:hypothetical protein
MTKRLPMLFPPGGSNRAGKGGLSGRPAKGPRACGAPIPTGGHSWYPMHKEIKRGLMRAILRDANLSPDEFKRLL